MGLGALERSYGHLLPTCAIINRITTLQSYLYYFGNLSCTYSKTDFVSLLHKVHYSYLFNIIQIDLR